MLLTRKFFYALSFEPYGGEKGLYDLGPPGSGIRNNMISYFRKHFIVEDDMLEISTPILTPESVFKASGHVERFHDLMVEDTVTKDCHRADHLLEEHLQALIEDPEYKGEKDALRLDFANADNFSKDELQAKLSEYGIKSPEGNLVSGVFPFNLMFRTDIGPKGGHTGYLRPETSQGIYLNFKRLLEFNGNRLPFIGAQIGTSFRNEIAPQNQLLRVREFEMAEIQHFFDPRSEGKFDKFDSVKDIVVQLYPASEQEGKQELLKMTLGYAVEQGMIRNEILAYYLGRSQLFLEKIGIQKDKIRFRQHLPNEMAHYATDCWDGDLLTSYGWVECMGHANRTCYDLEQHTKHNFKKEEFNIFMRYDKPIDKTSMKCTVVKSKVGKTFKKMAGKVTQALQALDEQGVCDLQASLDADGKKMMDVDGEQVEITADMVTIKQVKEKINGEKIVPYVIEPSYGLGRILYALLEQCYWVRNSNEEDPRLAPPAVLSFPPFMAPIQAAVFPLMCKPELVEYVEPVRKALVNAGIYTKVDASGASIGRRYARADELGVPFGITIDYQTVSDSTVTVRDRDSTDQFRLPIASLSDKIHRLIQGKERFKDLFEQHKE